MGVIWGTNSLTVCLLYVVYTWPDIVLKRAAHAGSVCRNSSPCSESVPNLASPLLLQWPLGQSAAKHPGCRSWLVCGPPPRRLTVQVDLLEYVANLETRGIPLSTAVLVVMEQGAERLAKQRRDTLDRSPRGEQMRWERGSAGNGWKGSLRPPLPFDPPSSPRWPLTFYPQLLWCGSGWWCPTNASLNHCVSVGETATRHLLPPTRGRPQLLLPSCFPFGFLYPCPLLLLAGLLAAGCLELMEAHGLTSAGGIGSIKEDKKGKGKTIKKRQQRKKNKGERF